MAMSVHARVAAGTAELSDLRFLIPGSCSIVSDPGDAMHLLLLSCDSSSIIADSHAMLEGPLVAWVLFMHQYKPIAHILLC